MKQGTLFNLSLVAVLMVGVAACTDATRPEGVGPVIPLEMGNSWTYRVSVAESDTSYAYEYSTTVVSIDSVGSYEFYKLVTPRQHYYGITYYLARSDSVFIPVHSKFGAVALSLEYFIPDGTQNYGQWYGDFGVPWTASPVDTTVITPSGEFTNCYVFRVAHPLPADKVISTVVCPGVGIVEKSRRDGSYVMKLIAYNVGGSCSNGSSP